MVQLDQIIAVSSKPSLFKAISSKANGLILEDLATGKNGFYSGRVYQFSPLDSMGLYTLSGTMPLKEVYENFLSKEGEFPIPGENEKEEIHREFFSKVIPEYDAYRVHARDMKKCLKWFHQLKELKLISPNENVSE